MDGMNFQLSGEILVVLWETIGFYHNKPMWREQGRKKETMLFDQTLPGKEFISRFFIIYPE